MCHGDTHGFNNHVYTDAEGVRRAAFFDFDDAGPGFLAYDLCVAVVEPATQSPHGA